MCTALAQSGQRNMLSLNGGSQWMEGTGKHKQGLYTPLGTCSYKVMRWQYGIFLFHLSMGVYSPQHIVHQLRAVPFLSPYW